MHGKPAPEQELPESEMAAPCIPWMARPAFTLSALAVAAFLLGNGCAATPKVSAKANLSIKEVAHLAAATSGPSATIAPGSGEITGGITVELTWATR